jgi:hypothetical protein
MVIKAAELVDQRGGVVPQGARTVAPLKMNLADDEEREDQPRSTEPIITPFLAPDAKGDLVHSKGASKMPKGIYKRKKKNATPQGEGAGQSAEQSAPRKRKARKARAPANRFGVFEDGSILVNTGSCKGTLTADEFAGLLAFGERLKSFA